MHEFFRSLRFNTEVMEVVHLMGYMILGGLLGYYIRQLYRRFALTLSNRDTFSATFPLLTIATILIIFVVKSSLALSLGLVGALSIVRFRAAIKEPEEIVYLFFCIAIGLSLGAEYYMIAIGGVLIFTCFVLGGHFVRLRSGGHELLLTLSGEIAQVCSGDLDKFTAEVSDVVGRSKVQRFDVEDGHLQYRIAVFPETDTAVGPMVAELQRRLPSCRVSFVNLDQLL